MKPTLSIRVKKNWYSLSVSGTGVTAASVATLDGGRNADGHPERRQIDQLRDDRLGIRSELQRHRHGATRNHGRAERAPPLQEPFANRSLVKYRLIVDEAGGWERYPALLRSLDAVARRHGREVADVALRWVLDRPAVAATMVGTFHGEHLDANLRALALTLTDEDREEIDAALAELNDLRGEPFGFEREEDGPHSRIMWKNLASRGD